jgi:hypothetical protein
MKPALVLLVVLVLAGCGGSSAPTTAPRAARTTPAAPTGRPTDAEIRRALALPDRVPLRQTGAAPAADIGVVRAWLDALRQGRVARAARLFGLPARFQNFMTVLLIRTPAQAMAVTDSLPCGAKMTRAGGAAGFVVYEARLTRRPGGDCGAGVGGIVRGAVLVRGGRMLEWYRLPDRPSPRRGQRVIPEGPIV